MKSRNEFGFWSLLARVSLALALGLAGASQVPAQPAPAVAKDQVSSTKDSAVVVKDEKADKGKAEDAVSKDGKADKGKAEDAVDKGKPLSPENRVWIVLAVMAAMSGLFAFVFSWQRRIEQSGYFAGIYKDAVEKVDFIRLAGPVNDKWVRGDYLKEIFLQRSPRGRAWMQESGNEKPQASPELRALAASLDSSYQLEYVERCLDEVPSVREEGGANPFEDNWAPSRTGMLSARPKGSRGGWDTGKPEDPEAQRSEAQFKKELGLFSDAAAVWVRRAMAQAWDWYQEDLADRGRKAQTSAGLALSVDFSALRGRGPEFVLEFTAVVVIIFAAVILGVLERLGSEQIGTLLAAIAGYVLGKGATRARTPEAEPVPEKREPSVAPAGGKQGGVGAQGS